MVAREPEQEIDYKETFGDDGNVHYLEILNSNFKYVPLIRHPSVMSKVRGRNNTVKEREMGGGGPKGGGTGINK